MATTGLFRLKASGIWLQPQGLGIGDRYVTREGCGTMECQKKLVNANSDTSPLKTPCRFSSRRTEKIRLTLLITSFQSSLPPRSNDRRFNRKETSRCLVLEVGNGWGVRDGRMFNDAPQAAGWVRRVRELDMVEEPQN